MASMICVNGSPRAVSKTGVLIDAVARAIQARTAVSRTDIFLSEAAPSLFAGLTRDRLSEVATDICRHIERADVLVVGSPVYRASYTGIFKHLFDLVDRNALRGRVAVLVATGASQLHGLVLEHQLRPLMSFFGLQTVATTLYGLEDDFLDGCMSTTLHGRAQRAASEAVALLALPRLVKFDAVMMDTST